MPVIKYKNKLTGLWTEVISNVPDVSGKLDTITEDNKLSYNLIKDTPDVYNKDEMDELLEQSGKVKSVNGMTGDVTIPVPDNATTESNGLMSALDKLKLDGLSNYNDTEVRGLISSLLTAIDTLTGKEDTTDIIDTLNEIISFLDTFKNTETLASVLAKFKSTMIEEVNQAILHKQDNINLTVIDGKICQIINIPD